MSFHGNSGGGSWGDDGHNGGHNGRGRFSLPSFTWKKDKEEAERLKRENELRKQQHQEDMRRMQEEMNEILAQSQQQRDQQLRRQRQDMDDILRKEKDQTETLHAKSEAERAAIERRNREEAERDARERQAREEERKRQMDQDTKKDRERAEQYRIEKEQNQLAYEESARAKDEAFRKEVEEQERILEQIRVEHEEKLSKLRHEADLERAAYAARMEDERQRANRAYELWSHRWRQQMTELFMMMRERIWNRQIEQKWADRLASLRDAHSNVHSGFFNLRFDLEDLTKRNGEQLSASERSQNEMYLNLLNEALNKEQEVMAIEAEEMSRMYRERPEARFLSDIENSARAIGNASAEFQRSLQKIIDHLANEYGSALNTVDWIAVTDSFSVLEKEVDNIPTIFSLKEKYDQH